jgi:ABC-type lipoprotein export system ATPase subunit
MYIKSLIYEDQSTSWKLEKIEFNNPLTLLVGVSGVGKTQILKSLLNLQNISNGSHVQGFKWEIEFQTNKGFNCKWVGEFEGLIISGTRFLFENRPDFKLNSPPLYYEKLFINDKEVIDRNKERIKFKGKETVRLPEYESVIYLLKEEDLIKDVFNAFTRIKLDNNFNISLSPISLCQSDNFEATLAKYNTIESIRNSEETIINKFYLCSKNNPIIFEDIKYLFTDIFPNIENLAVDVVDTIMLNRVLLSIAIKEKNVSQWIHWNQISSGMRRTLMLITELYLCADNSVILIDEFENSLGINCIDELTLSILDSDRNLQFIITSHHPYIINKIDCHYWKLVTRKGSVVKAEDATLYGIGRSKHEAFTQLLNLDEYIEGIES